MFTKLGYAQNLCTYFFTLGDLGRRRAWTVGVDHVGLGTDMDGNLKPVLGDYRQLPDWMTALRAKGLSASDVAKVAGGNMQRVLSQVIG